MIITAPAVNTAPPPPVATAGSAPAQPLPAVIPRGDARARYDAMARDFAANPRGNFTVQIQILCEPSNLEMAMRAGGDNVWFVPQPIGARSCYRVFWGRYATREEAQRAFAQVPASLRDANSAVRPVPRG
jgi:septal ring-binding cell division protein DamX